MSKEEFIQEFAPIVQKYAEEYGYSQEVCAAIIAQACYESDYGNSDAAQEAYNFFGIMHGGKTVWQGKTYNLEDGQFYTNDEIYIYPGNQKYVRAYDSLEEGVKGYFDLLDQKNSSGEYLYGDLRTISDPEEYAKQIAAHGYSGNSKEGYASNVIGIMSDCDIVSYVEQNPLNESKMSEEKDASDKSSDLISVDYDFVKAYMDKFMEDVESFGLLTQDIINISTNGSATLSTSINSFNNYSANSIEFLNSIGILQNNILTIAESYANLDSEMASTLSLTAITNIKALDFSDLNNFYDTPVAIDLIATSGDILISKDILNSFFSESNPIISSLLTDISDTKKLKATLDSFIEESCSNLQGEEWDIIRNKCNEFSDLCNKKVNYAQSLINGITDACKKLLNYLEDYDELDTSRIPEFEEEKQATIDLINQLNNEIESLRAEEGTFPITDASGNIVGYYTIDNSAAIAACESQIEVCEQIKVELERILTKLGQLPSEDSIASNIVASAEGDNKTENIQVSSVVNSAANNLSLSDENVNVKGISEVSNDINQSFAETSATASVSTNNANNEGDNTHLGDGSRAETITQLANTTGNSSTNNNQNITTNYDTVNAEVPNNDNVSANQNSYNDENIHDNNIDGNNMSDLSLNDNLEEVEENFYIVQPGDTLYAIAKRYNTTVEKLYADNKDIIGNNPNLIFPNQKLVIK